MAVAKGTKFPNRKKAPPRSLESRQKQSETHKSRQAQGLYKHRGWTAGTKGVVKLSEESRKKISESLKGNVPWNTGLTKINTPVLARMGFQKGEKNPAWKEGITPLVKAIRTCFEYKQWCKEVFSRDNYLCQKYMVRGHRKNRLDVHHIKPFAEIIQEHNIKTLQDALACTELWDIMNGITLCRKAHKEFHNRYGIKHNTFSQLQEFINDTYEGIYTRADRENKLDREIRVS